MQQKSRLELYKAFTDFVGENIQQERQDVNRRMLSVLLWCFVFPAIIALLVLVLVMFGVLPAKARSYLDLIILLFPIAYSVYVISSEVLVNIPQMIRKGGVAATLTQAQKEGVWREKVGDGMRSAVHGGIDEWSWIVESFRADLGKLKFRNGYLTAFAGAVFFLVMQGIDLIGEAETVPVVWVQSPMGWIQNTANDFSQFIGLGLFLVLFYLSGLQTYHSLSRYLNCAELLLLEMRVGFRQANK